MQSRNTGVSLPDETMLGEARREGIHMPTNRNRTEKEKEKEKQAISESSHYSIPRISEGGNGQIVGFVMILVHIVRICIFWSSVRSIPQTKEKLETCSSSDE